MRTIHETFVQATPERIFAVVADVEGWPALDRAYRWCRILERHQEGLVFEMAGLIRGVPARWTATQARFPADHRIIFRHIRGITTGMVVEWRLTPTPQGVRVTLTHDLELRWLLLARAAFEGFVGSVFIDWIAARTMQRVKRAAEMG